MSSILKISEVTQNISATSDSCIKAQIKITNTSNAYINNLKLIIKPKEIPILEQCIIRQRGALSFDTAFDQLDVGNLAPDETAYFEYAFKPAKDICSLSSQIIIRYTPEYSNMEIMANVTDLLDSE
ncbi:hypothetical protein [Cellulosilyticum sp. I15G10I2]|uniref:hypothetical protein n=1 Tax=Cellulosilyticum sp. I15G10I2 TaxID=1892843 RepID=UPI00085C5B39|nr:hypothetical protein [Cellulosilyticum sp. I15G10I2]